MQFEIKWLRESVDTGLSSRVHDLTKSIYSNNICANIAAAYHEDQRIYSQVSVVLFTVLHWQYAEYLLVPIMLVSMGKTLDRHQLDVYMFSKSLSLVKGFYYQCFEGRQQNYQWSYLFKGFHKFPLLILQLQVTLSQHGTFHQATSVERTLCSMIFMTL